MSRLLAISFFIAIFAGNSWAQNSGASVPPPTSPVEAPAPGTADATYLICKNKAVVRTLRVSKKQNGGCMATYTKDGVDQVVGNSWTIERCAKVIGNIRENLEKANWKCKDISEARVSSSEGG